MTREYQIRFDEAESLAKFFKSINCAGVLLTGSVAHGTVSDKSDLDLIVFADLSKRLYEEICRKLGVKDAIGAELIAQHNPKIVILRPQRKGFEVGINLYDKSTMQHISNIDHGIVKVLRESEFEENQVSRSEALINLKGEYLNPPLKIRETFQGRTIQKLHPFFETKEDMYLSAIPVGFLMDPKVLTEKDDYVGVQLKHFNQNLKSKLINIHGEKPNHPISLFNVIPKEIQEKTPSMLEKRLRTYF